MTNNAQEEERRKFDEYCEENIMGMLNPEFCFRIWLARAQQPAKVSLEWQPIETAPKDGTQLLLAGIYPWPVIGCFNGCHNQWCYANHQVEPVDGVWNDYYYETDSVHPSDLIKLKWMPLPEIPPATGRGDRI